ncbi:hypothetical protein ONZ43_g2159 [Nemania bipapillata]|uniref:Uncharacterized protein n=1 Tax=Nemania bipapillata TaxID=110536 RepID=A0ACC2J1K9_9PEZI|nr:hypothetical protein ONZ43_g2159 [Nemania bipapillata]
MEVEIGSSSAYDPTSHPAKSSAQAKVQRQQLQEEDCESQLGYAFSKQRKLWILAVIFFVQISMNLNTSLYSNGIPGIVEEFHVSETLACCGVVFFLITYAFGCPIIGGFVELLPPKVAWRWCTWIQIIFGGAVQLVHFLAVPETRATIILDRVARKRREAGQDPNLYGPGEITPFRERFTMTELIQTWSRPFRLLLTEKIVFLLSMLSGFSDAIVFIQIQAMNLVYKQWDFNCWQIGLAFIPFALGYCIGWAALIPAFKRKQRRRIANPHDEYAQFELRLCPLVCTAPCLIIGLVIFAFTNDGPPLPWIYSMVGTTLIGIANYCIYMATIDYMVCVYGPYAASATGSNGWARDMMAGLLTLPAIGLYTSIDVRDGKTYRWPSFILALAAGLLALGAYQVKKKGASFRRTSKFAQRLVSRDEEAQGVPNNGHGSVAVVAEAAGALAPPAPFEAVLLSGVVEGAQAAEDAQHDEGAQGAEDAQEPAEDAQEPAEDAQEPAEDAQEPAEDAQEPAGDAQEPAGDAQEPAAIQPVDIPASVYSEIELGWGPHRRTFDPLSPYGSYIASVHAASRRQNRQASRIRAKQRRRRNQAIMRNPPGASIVERVAGRLRNPTPQHGAAPGEPDN